MSNTSFNFLSESDLAKYDKESIINKSLSELEDELDNYRKYLHENEEELTNECIKQNEDSVLISDFRSMQKLPDITEITKKSLFLNRFVIDDPLQPLSFKNLNFINDDRRARGYDPITETQAKLQLWERLQYMKSLLPGVNANIGYIKFYPLSKEPTNEMLDIIQIPDLSFPEKFPEVYNWFKNKIIVKTVNDERQLVDLIEPCKQLGISFENDTYFGLFFPAFMQKIFLTGNTHRYENVIPQMDIFSKWKEDEITKSIRDRFVELVKNNDFRLKFGAIASTNSNFESSFLSEVLDEQTGVDEKAIRIITSINLPSFENLDFTKTMEIRQFFDESFENFRTQLKDDVIFLQSNSEDDLIRFSNELGAKYEARIKEIEKKLKFKFNVTGFDFIPLAIDIATILTTANPVPMALTGANIIHKLYGGFSSGSKEARENSCYFLYKINK